MWYGRDMIFIIFLLAAILITLLGAWAVVGNALLLLGVAIGAILGLIVVYYICSALSKVF